MCVEALPHLLQTSAVDSSLVEISTRKQFSTSPLVLTLRKLPFYEFFSRKLRNPPSIQNTVISRNSTKPLAKRTAMFYLALPVIWYAAPAHTSGYTHKNCDTKSRTRRQNAHLLYVVYYFPSKDSIQYENLIVTLDFSSINYFWKNHNSKEVSQKLTPRLNTFVSLPEHLFRQKKSKDNFFTF